MTGLGRAHHHQKLLLFISDRAGIAIRPLNRRILARAAWNGHLRNAMSNFPMSESPQTLRSVNDQSSSFSFDYDSEGQHPCATIFLFPPASTPRFGTLQKTVTQMLYILVSRPRYLMCVPLQGDAVRRPLRFVRLVLPSD